MQRFFWNDFPSTHGMIFGEVIQNCWRKRYSSIVELEYTITIDSCTSLKIAPVMDNNEMDSGSKSARNSCRRTQLSKFMSSAESANAEAFDRLALRVRCIHMNCGSLQTFNNSSSSALSFDFV